MLCFCPKTWLFPKGDFSPPPIRPPSMVQVKFLALDEADRMLDMGTLAYFGKYFCFGNFSEEKTTTKKGPKGGLITIFVLLEDVHVMVGFAFRFGRKSAKVDYQTTHGWKVFLNLNLTIPR